MASEFANQIYYCFEKMELELYHYRLLLLLLLTMGVILKIVMGLELEKYYRFERNKFCRCDNKDAW